MLLHASDGNLHWTELQKDLGRELYLQRSILTKLRANGVLQCAKAM